MLYLSTVDAARTGTSQIEGLNLNSKYISLYRLKFFLTPIWRVFIVEDLSFDFDARA